MPLGVDARRHFQCAVDALVVVVQDLQVEGDGQLGEAAKPVWVAQVNLELRVERLLVAVLPRARLAAHGYLDAALPSKPGVGLCPVLVALV